MTAALKQLRSQRATPPRLPKQEDPSTCLRVKGLRDPLGRVMNELFLLTPSDSR